MQTPQANWFATVDAETDVLLEGVRALDEIRDRVEQREGVSVPLVWFVRFQRDHTATIRNDSREFFEGPVTKVFDGFRLMEPEIARLVARGDELGWHYHAYHYVHRDDLPHDVRVENVAADLTACAAAIRERGMTPALRAFRWGWWFNPDKRLTAVLKSLGFDVDASIDPGEAGRTVAKFASRYGEPPTTVAREIDGTHFFPRVNTLLVHDYNVVAHDLGWRRADEEEAAERSAGFEQRLTELVRSAAAAGGRCATYAMALEDV